MIVSLRALRARSAVAEPESALDADSRTLHVRCGHDIMHKLAVAGFEGDFLWFGDPYIEGPVPRTASLEAFVRVRAAFLASRYPGQGPEDGLLESYRDLERCRDYERVCIWLEHDSYDQLVLAKLLDYFADPASRPRDLRFISVTRFPGVERFIGIGQLPPEALRVLWNDFEPLTEAHIATGREAWNALTAPSPEPLAALARSGPPALPILGKALARHLRELPSTANGLGLTEALTLRILDEQGSMNAPRLFGWYTNHYEPLPFLGDSGYWHALRSLAEAATPAISIVERADVTAEHKRNWDVSLLDFGRALLRGEADWLTANRVERWVGGVHIDSATPPHWRYDEPSETVVRR